MVAALKYSGKLHFGRLIGNLLSAHIAQSIDLFPDVIVPVPLHISRLRERGFNQSEHIARHLADRLNCKLDTKLLRRVRNTQSQMGLPARQRKKNVRGAFEIAASLKGKRVALVDDVVTTSSTVNEIARELRRAGAQHIAVWSFARAAAQGIEA